MPLTLCPQLCLTPSTSAVQKENISATRDPESSSSVGRGKVDDDDHDLLTFGEAGEWLRLEIAAAQTLVVDLVNSGPPDEQANARTPLAALRSAALRNAAQPINDDNFERFFGYPGKSKLRVRALLRRSTKKTVRKVTGGKSSLESPSDWPAEGLLVHTAEPGPQGFRIVDVWQSEEASKRFGELLEPILQEVGIDDRPEKYDAVAIVSA